MLTVCFLVTSELVSCGVGNVGAGVGVSVDVGCQNSGSRPCRAADRRSPPGRARRAVRAPGPTDLVGVTWAAGPAANRRSADIKEIGFPGCTAPKLVMCCLTCGFAESATRLGNTR